MVVRIRIWSWDWNKSAGDTGGIAGQNVARVHSLGALDYFFQVHLDSSTRFLYALFFMLPKMGASQWIW